MRTHAEPSTGDDQVVLVAYGVRQDEAAPTLGDLATAALRAANVPIDVVSAGRTVGGGTPAHRWLEVSEASRPTKLKILGASETEVERELDRLAQETGVPRAPLDVIRSADWPVVGLFGLPPA